MGFIIGGGSGGSGLPDYSLTPIIYPRKWVNGNYVEEVSFSLQIPAFNQALIFLGITLKSEILVPIEISVFIFNENTQRWEFWQNWHIFENSSSWHLRILNSINSNRIFSGVLRYSKASISSRA